MSAIFKTRIIHWGDRMPTARNRQKHQSKSLIAGGLRKRTLIVGAVIMGALLVLGGAALFFIGGVRMSQSNQLTKYLNEKYGQEFVVENIHDEGSGIGVKGAWVADAHPKTDPSLEFKVGISQTTNKISVDTFLQELWTRQGTGEVENFLAKEIPENEGFILKIEPGRKLYESINGHTPNLATVLENDKNLIVYSLVVRSSIDIKSDEPSSAQMEKALKIVNFVKAKNITPASFVYYNYRDASYSDHDDAGRQRYQYGIHVERDEIKDISSISDLKKYFKTLGR